MATGELRATRALTEPGGGSDLQNMSTTALPDGLENSADLLAKTVSLRLLYICLTSHTGNAARE
jgi:hypothetical protein